MDVKEKTPKVNVDFLKVKRTIVNFIVPLICTAVMGLLVFLVIYPYFTEGPTLRSEITQKSNLESQLKAKKTKLQDLRDFRSVIDENSLLVNRALVSEPLIPELLTQISQIADETGLELSKLTYSYGGASAGEGEEAFQRISISMGARGSYDQLVVFMKSIETAIRIVEVSDLRYSYEQDEGFYTLTITLSSPYLYVQSDAVTDEPVVFDITDQRFLALINMLKDYKYYEISAEDLVPVIEETEEVEETTPSEELFVTPVEESSTEPGTPF